MARKYSCLQRHQLRGRHSTRLLKAEVVALMQCFDAIRHPQALSVDSVDSAPVDRCSTCPQRFIQTVAEAHTLDEGETFRKYEADLEAGFAIAGSRIARGRAPRGIGVYLRSTSLDAASHEKS